MAEKDDFKTQPAYVTTSFAGTEFKYIFWSRLRTDLHMAFGQTVATKNLPSTKVIAGTNNFKPFRATKNHGGKKGFEGSFCSDEKEDELRKNGYTLTKKREKIYQYGDTAKIYTVEIQGVKFAWVRSIIPKEVKLKDLFIEEGKVNEPLIFGASFPRPAVIKKVVNGRSFQTFCGGLALESNGRLKPNLLNDGWRIMKSALYTQLHLQQIYRIK